MAFPRASADVSTNRVLGARRFSPIAVLLAVTLAWAGSLAAQTEETPTNVQLDIDEERDEISLSVDESTGLGLLDFLKIAEKVTGKRFTFSSNDVQTSAGSGTEITWLGTQRLRRDQFFEFFQTMLYIKGFSCVTRGEGNLEIVELINNNGPRRAEVQLSARYVPYEDLSSFKNRTGEQILTSIPLKYLSAPNATNALRPFFASGTPGSVIPGNVGDNRSLILQGYAPIIFGLSELLRIMDVAPEEVAIITRISRLEFATAEELEPVLKGVLVDRAQRPQQAAQTGGQINPEQQVELTVYPYPQFNAIVLKGTEKQVIEAEELIAQLDNPYDTSGGGMHVIELQNVLADELRETLNQFITEDLQAEQRAQATGGAANARQPRRTVVVAHPPSNRLLISATQNNYRQLENIVRELDTLQPQVLIEAALVELSTTRFKRFGIELAGVDLADGDFTRAFGVTSFGLSEFTDTDADGFPDTRLPDFTNPLQGITGGIISSDDFAIPVLVNALANDDDANILSVPSVLVNNNQEATVRSEEERPTQSVTQGNATTQSGFSNFQGAGIELQISPTINSENFLRLNISLNVSRFTTPFDPESVTPGVRITRQVTTQVTMPSGDTMVLGGVLEDTVTEADSGIPFLKDIPILGWLFRNYSQAEEKTNLYFFVTPRILDEPDFSDLAQVSFERKLQASEYIGERRVKIVDPDWRGTAHGPLDGPGSTIEDLDRRGGFDLPTRSTRTRDTVELPVGGQIPTGPVDPSTPAPDSPSGSSIRESR